ncbi:hypothetical protein IM543_11295 [Massilia sp. UMI-21]|nr:hypothetical protein IM543_11295 [Massilia sp. UMI-21]
MADADTTVFRTCTRCKVSKPATAEFFHAYKRSPDGRRAICRICRAEDHAEHRDERLPQRRAHYQANKERLCATVRAYYVENAEAQRQRALERHFRNHEDRLEKMREYRAANVDALNERRRPKARAAFHARYGTDLEFTLKHRVRALLRVTLQKGRSGKRMAELLGYTADDLRMHLERQFTKGMSWEWFMAGEIHIDHIIPVASFGIIEEDSDAFRQCWALPNLRPAWAKDNISRQDKVLTLL